MPLSRNVRIYAAGVLIKESQCDFTWDEVRAERNKDLAESDWRAVKDRVLPNLWKDYRTFLRDLPQNFDSANEAADAWAAYDIPE